MLDSSFGSQLISSCLFCPTESHDISLFIRYIEFRIGEIAQELIIEMTIHTQRLSFLNPQRDYNGLDVLILFFCSLLPISFIQII